MHRATCHGYHMPPYPCIGAHQLAGQCVFKIALRPCVPKLKHMQQVVSHQVCISSRFLSVHSPGAFFVGSLCHSRQCSWKNLIILACTFGSPQMYFAGHLKPLLKTSRETGVKTCWNFPRHTPGEISRLKGKGALTSPSKRQGSNNKGTIFSAKSCL